MSRKQRAELGVAGGDEQEYEGREDAYETSERERAEAKDVEASKVIVRLKDAQRIDSTFPRGCSCATAHGDRPRACSVPALHH